MDFWVLSHLCFLERSYRKMKCVWEQEDRPTICPHAWEMDLTSSRVASVISLDLFLSCIPPTLSIISFCFLTVLLMNHLVSIAIYTRLWLWFHPSYLIEIEIWDQCSFATALVFLELFSQSGCRFCLVTQTFLRNQSFVSIMERGVLCVCVCRWSGHWSNSATWTCPKTIWRWLKSRYPAVKTCRICCCPTTVWRSCQGL